MSLSHPARGGEIPTAFLAVATPPIHSTPARGSAIPTALSAPTLFHLSIFEVNALAGGGVISIAALLAMF
jgi:hypothetical protein